MFRTVSAAAIAVAISAHAASAEGVKVVGNVRTDAAAIAAHVPLGAGGKADADVLDDAVKSLYATGAFEDVKAEAAGRSVTVTVVERPVVTAVSFEGNSRLKDEALARAAGFEPGDYWDASAAPQAQAAISAAYAAVARPDAFAGVEAVPDGEGRVRLAVRVTEGARSGVYDVWFKGNESFTASRLRTAVSTKEAGLFTRLTNADAYLPEKVEADRASLLAFYRERGYADARILVADVDRHDEGFAVGFVIEEGERYVVSSARVDTEVEGFAAMARAAAASVEGSVYSPRALRLAADRMEEGLVGTGMFPVRVAPRVTSLPGGRVDVAFVAEPAARVYVDRIEIEGNMRTRDAVLRRELDLSEGDLLDAALLRRAERRLKRLGLFDSVAVSVRPGSAEDRAVLVIAVTERKTGELSAGGGWSTADGLLANVSLGQSNIGGTGRSGRVFAGRSDAGTSFGASLVEPWFLGRRITAGADVFRTADERRSGGTALYDETATGFRLSATAPITERASASLRYGLSHREVSDVDARISGAFGGPALVTAGEGFVSSVGWSAVWDGLDDPRSPRQGFRGEFSQDFAGLGGDATWLRTEASAHWYSPLSHSSPVVAHLGVRGGHVTGLGSGLAFIDHFQAGPRIVRGFEAGGFGPRDASTGFGLGGTAYLSATAEAIAPFPFIAPEHGLKAVAFADAGTLWSPDSGSVLSSGASVLPGASALRASVGAGILWDSPFGTLRADFAVPVAKADGDREQVFTFSGGTRF